MISKMPRGGFLTACVLLAGCGDGGFSLFGGSGWRLVENQDRLTGHTQSHAEMITHLDGGGQVTLRAECAAEPGALPGLRINGEISALGPQQPLDQVSQWRAAAGRDEGDLLVSMTGRDGFTISVSANPTATIEPSDMNAALLSSGAPVRAEVAREGENPILNFRNSDDAFQAMVRRCRLQAGQAAPTALMQTPENAEPAPEDQTSAPAPSAAPQAQTRTQINAPQRVVVPPGASGGPAPLPPSQSGSGQRAPLPPGASNKP